VAVLPFHSFSLTRSDVARAAGDSAWVRLTDELNLNPDVEVLDRRRIDSLATEQNLAAGVISDEVAARVGQILGASHVVAGNIYLDPRTARLDVRLVHVASAQPVRPPLKKSGGHDQLGALVEALASEFARDIGFAGKPRTTDSKKPAQARAALARLRKNGTSPP
jgi:hypothetical protein